MEPEKALIVVGITLAVVLVINAGILVTFLRTKSSERFKIIGKAIQIVRDPFRSENESINELRERVAKFENQVPPGSENDH
jgi:polyhydroxyalkanoate synthesis regulator phasin